MANETKAARAPDSLDGLGMTELSRLFDAAKFAKLEATNALQIATADVDRISKAIAKALGLNMSVTATVATALAAAPAAVEQPAAGKRVRLTNDAKAKLKNDILNALEGKREGVATSRILEHLHYAGWKKGVNLPETWTTTLTEMRDTDKTIISDGERAKMVYISKKR